MASSLAGAKGKGGGTEEDKTFPDAKGGIPQLEDVAQRIKLGKVKNVVIMAGAGISTSAGIPDFRSPETGLYANLEKYKLPYPEAIFDIEYFVDNPEAFYALSKELYPGNFKPTPTHYFFKLLKDKNLLKAVFTQNIDTLERIAGLDDESVIEAHGSFAEAECLECKRQYTKEAIKPQIELGQVVRCENPKCKGVKGALVKPKIVFFGEGLPERFFNRMPDLASADLLIVLGTSLTVQPFASLVNYVPHSTPRLLINLESVGEVPRGKYPSGMKKPPDGFDFDGRTKRKEGIRDVRWLGGCDEGVRKLCEMLGWEAELRRLVERGDKAFEKSREVEGGESETEVEEEGGEEETVAGSEVEEEEDKGDEVDALVAKVEVVTLADAAQTVTPKGPAL